MAIVMIPAIRAVAAAMAGNVKAGSASLNPAVRIVGFTKMM